MRNYDPPVMGVRASHPQEDGAYVVAERKNSSGGPWPATRDSRRTDPGQVEFEYRKAEAILDELHALSVEDDLQPGWQDLEADTAGGQWVLFYDCEECDEEALAALRSVVAVLLDQAKAEHRDLRDDELDAIEAAEGEVPARIAAAARSALADRIKRAEHAVKVFRGYVEKAEHKGDAAAQELDDLQEAAGMPGCDALAIVKLRRVAREQLTAATAELDKARGELGRAVSELAALRRSAASGRPVTPDDVAVDLSDFDVWISVDDPTFIEWQAVQAEVVLVEDLTESATGELSSDSHTDSDAMEITDAV